MHVAQHGAFPSACYAVFGLVACCGCLGGGNPFYLGLILCILCSGGGARGLGLPGRFS